MFKSAWDAALPVYAIGTALVMVFSSLLKTDERRSSVTLWDRSAQSQTLQKPHLPGKSRWRRTPFASVPIGTGYFDGQPNRSSSLIRCHGSFWAGNGQAALKFEKGHCRPSAGQNAELLCIRAKTCVEFITSGSGPISTMISA